MTAEEFLGLDIGDKRIGVARGSSIARLAEPLAVLLVETSTAALKKMVAEHKPAGIVVGLPRNLDSQETPQTARVRAWVDQAKKAFSQTFYWQDEALTSHEALAKHGAQKSDVDALAATIILQDFLNSSEAERVVC